MRIKLSAFLQMKPNVYIYQKLGWRIALFYMIILGRMYFLLRQEEKRKITASLEKVFGERKGRSELKAMANHVFRGIFCHYYEKIFNAYTDIHGLRTFLFGSVIPQGLERLDHALEAGRGVLFVTGHYGGIEYIPIYLALKGYPISVIAKFSTAQLKETLHAKTSPLGLRIIDGSQKNGVLKCGTHIENPGFSALDSKGQRIGFDVDFCRAVAAAVNVPEVKYTPLTSKERLPALLLEAQREPAGERGLAGAFRAHHEHLRRALGGVAHRLVPAAEHLDQLLVDDADHLLTGGDRVEHLLAERPLADARDEVAHDLEVHVGFEQRNAHFAQRLVEILLRDLPGGSEAAERVLEAVG